MASTKISAMTAASALVGTELIAGVQSGGNVKITANQLATFIGAWKTTGTTTVTNPTISGSVTFSDTILIGGTSATLRNALLQVGNADANSYPANDVAILVSRTKSGGGSSHAFATTTSTSQDSGNAFDDRSQMGTSSASPDHWVSFQSRPSVTVTNPMNAYYAFYDARSFDGGGSGGRVANSFGVYISNITPTGTGIITNQIGVNIEALTGGANNVAFKSVGTTKSQFGGNIEVGNGSTGTSDLKVIASGSQFPSIGFWNASAVSFYAGLKADVGASTLSIWNDLVKVAEFNDANFGIGVTGATALLQIKAGSTTTAPVKLTAGTNKTTAAAGEVEYDGTNLFFTRTGTTRENVLVAVDNATAPSTTATPTFTSYYGGNTKALGDPNRWMSVNILGTVYKVPLYT